jgi:aspartate-semialdehyde dehydrogenase
MTVIDVDDYDFSKAQIGLFSAGGSVSEKYAPIAAAAGCVVIDNTAHFRYDRDIPLVVPEVNPHAIAQYKNRGIIANPNCSTIQMLVALKPIHDAVGIARINVANWPRRLARCSISRISKSRCTQSVSLLTCCRRSMCSWRTVTPRKR